MKKIVFLLLALWAFNILDAQVNYGSNNGKYLKIKDSKVYYEVYGQGQPLLLLHGGFGSIKNFNKVIGPLSKHFKVYAMDSPGQGRSSQIDSISYQIYADYYGAFIDSMHLKNVNVIGWSDGGNSAFILAYDRPDVINKVIVSGANSDTDGYQPGAIEEMNSWKPETINQMLTDYWLTDFKKLSPNKDTWQKSFIQLRNMWVTKNVISDNHLSKIKSKFLLVYGDKDEQTLEHSIHLYRTINGSQLAILPNTTHFTFQEKSNTMVSMAVEFFGKK
jgi:pimeloyl-ACP methyl ester carboxylesterase